MCRSCFVLWLMATAPTLASDPTKPHRLPRKEPTYASKAPRYCLLVFGQKAPLEVWLVGDGQQLYVDFNGNGDLTEEGKRPAAVMGDPSLFEVGPLPVPYPGVMLRVRHEIKDQCWRLDGFTVSVPGRGEEWIPGALFGPTSRDAPVLFAGGRLTMGLHLKPHLVPGKEGCLNAWLGTRNLRLAEPTLLDVETEPAPGQPGVPAHAHPVAEFEFPSRQGPPIKVTVPLTSRE